METSINKSFSGDKTILIKCNLSKFFFYTKKKLNEDKEDELYYFYLNWCFVNVTLHMYEQNMYIILMFATVHWYVILVRKMSFHQVDRVYPNLQGVY